MCNENARRLLQFSSEHNLLISNTLFPHKRIHKYTWECRGKGLRSLIDYFLVGKEARKQVVDTKVVRGAEIGSNHYLVLLKIKLKAKRRTGGEGHAQTRGKVRINRLKDNDVRREFQVVIGEMYGGARVRGHLCGSDAELAWKEMKDCLVKTATRVCGVTKRRKGAVKRTK